MIEIGNSITTQDNRGTSNPLFLVQQKVRIWGMDSDYSNEYDWFDRNNDNVKADEEKAALLDEGDVLPGVDSSYWEKSYYKDTWQFVTACFTESGCENYISRNSHNLNKPRVYAVSLYQNHEMIDVRNSLMERCDIELEPSE